MTPTNLEILVVDGVVDEVIQQIKSGKEADVFLVRKGEGLLAAKVYKERDHRNFKNNAGYKEGRVARNSRDQRAMDKGSRFGREMSESAWKSAEADALFKLHAVGARVPTPDVFYEGILVMSLVMDAEGRPAPRLADTRLTAPQALEMQKELLRQIALLLTCDLIHGDLSAFNILLAHDGPMIIDLPQVVSAAHNSRAEAFLRRDVANVTRYLGQYAPEILRRPDGGADLWSRYQRRELFAGYVPDIANLRDDLAFMGFRRERRGHRGRGHRPPGGHPPQGSGQSGHAAGHPGHSAPRPEAAPASTAPVALPATVAPAAGVGLPQRREYRPEAPRHHGQPRRHGSPPAGGQRPGGHSSGARPPGSGGPHPRPHGANGAAGPSRPPHPAPSSHVQAGPRPGGPHGQGGTRPGGPHDQAGPRPGGPHGHSAPRPGASHGQGAPRPDGNPHRRRRRRFH